SGHSCSSRTPPLYSNLTPEPFCSEAASQVFSGVSRNGISAGVKSVVRMYTLTWAFGSQVQKPMPGARRQSASGWLDWGLRRVMLRRFLILLSSLCVFAVPALAQSGSTNQGVSVDLTKAASGSLPLQIVVLLTLLSFIPAILISMTCFTRLIVVYH